ncbi:unnamed protein product [Lactuca saligna]|uniref:Protein kinase domain-containing protein n=1 Tax=Lactuca saligna TaxID=75948 RepID=A0AA35ZWF4_LACSI|nr:unnamed protein product [Lactuca saligna]
MRWFGVEADCNVLVLDLLGSSFEDLFNFCSRKMSLKNVLMLADQMINRVEFIHYKSFLHRDMKPYNFLMGLGRRANQNKNLTGTTRYSSMNTHLGIEEVAVLALLLPPPTTTMDDHPVAGLPALEPYARLFHWYYVIASPFATQRLLLGLLEAPSSWAPNALDDVGQLV